MYVFIEKKEKLEKKEKIIFELSLIPPLIWSSAGCVSLSVKGCLAKFI